MHKRTRKKFDPRLKAAMAEVRHIMDKYDIGGSVVLVSKNFSEVLTQFPKWTIVDVEPKAGENGTDRVRLSTEILGEGSTKEERKRAIELSCHAIGSMQRAANMMSGELGKFLDMIQDYFQITFKQSKYHPHDEEGDLAAMDPRNHADPKNRFIMN